MAAVLTAVLLRSTAGMLPWDGNLCALGLALQWTTSTTGGQEVCAWALLTQLG